MGARDTARTQPRNQESLAFMSNRGPSHALRRLVMQPLWLPVLITMTLLISSMALLVFLIYTGLHRFDPLYAHARQMAELRTVVNVVERARGRDARPAASVSSELRQLARRGAWLSPSTAQRLEAASAALRGAGGLSVGASLSRALQRLKRAQEAEDAASLGTFEKVHEAARRALQLALITLIVFPLLVVAFLYGLHGRLVAPLGRLADLLTTLAERKYQPLEAHGVTPTLRPLFSSYNQLVSRLELLEKKHANRERELSAAVEKASRSLLLTHSALTRAERLAAAGEVAAGLAHDLRNPLAGIRLALHNLESESGDRETTDRLKLIGGELDRLVSTLNNHLDRARHRPEPPSAIPIDEALRNAAQLQGFSAGGGVRLHIDAPAELCCRLPETGFRHALFNLMGNACEALERRGGEVRVRAETADSTLRILIEDDGPGFSDEQLRNGPRAFVSEKAGGTGLGLITARRFAVECGGRLELSNRERGGARVVLTLPCAACEAHARA